MIDQPLTSNPFLTLIHAHDKVWNDHSWDWRVRSDTCNILWSLAIAVAEREVSRSGGSVKAKDRIVEWKKTQSDPKTHDQWNATNRNMVIRKLTEYEYALYRNGRSCGTYLNLGRAKTAAENYA